MNIVLTETQQDGDSVYIYLRTKDVHRFVPDRNIRIVVDRVLFNDVGRLLADDCLQLAREYGQSTTDDLLRIYRLNQQMEVGINPFVIRGARQAVRNEPVADRAIREARRMRDILNQPVPQGFNAIEVPQE